MTTTPEAKLANYWRRRVKLEWSDFDALVGAQPPPSAHVDVRRPVTEEAMLSGHISYREAVRDLSVAIWGGYPLTFFEFHLAVACHLLLADGVPYLEFYKTHWYETAERRGYGKLPRKRKVKVKVKKEEEGKGRSCATPKSK